MTDELAIVSGLPRSGTSMMMSMLEAGGIPALTDNVRRADEDNPRGYYEFEPVKQLKTDAGWVPDARGKVVKMVSALLPDLPEACRYRVVFMERHMAEILASQRAMLARNGHPADPAGEERQAELFGRHLASLRTWLARQENFTVLYVHYNELLAAPADHIARLNDFFGGDLDTAAMAAVVDRSLYRQRESTRAGSRP
jgi:hypothetical protein